MQGRRVLHNFLLNQKSVLQGPRVLSKYITYIRIMTVLPRSSKVLYADK